MKNRMRKPYKIYIYMCVEIKKNQSYFVSQTLTGNIAFNQREYMSYVNVDFDSTDYQAPEKAVKHLVKRFQSPQYPHTFRECEYTTKLLGLACRKQSANFNATNSTNQLCDDLSILNYNPTISNYLVEKAIFSVPG